MYQLLQSRLPDALHWHPFMLQALPIIAFVLIVVALALKLKSLSTHFFGAKPNAGPPLTVTLYLSGVFVIATLALLFRLTLTMFGDYQEFWWYIMAALAVAFIICGVIASLRQKSFEAILVAASLAQVGYLLLGLVSGNEAALTAIAYYLFTYLFILSGAFAVLIALRPKDDSAASLSPLAGLRHRNPLAALLLIIFVIALAGFPPPPVFSPAISFLTRFSNLAIAISPGSPHSPRSRSRSPICVSPGVPGAPRHPSNKSKRHFLLRRTRSHRSRRLRVCNSCSGPVF